MMSIEEWQEYEADSLKRMDPLLREIVESLSEKRLVWAKRMGFVNSMVPIRTTPKIGRNDSCPCGSGKKYKKCCGR